MMYSIWAQRVLGWDGLLPAIVWGLSALAASIFPGNRGLLESLTLFLPIVAFLIRLRVGWRAIQSNHCGT